MRDRPDAQTLIALAQRAMREGGDAAAIARALAIAERERAAGNAPLERCRAVLARRYGDGELAGLLARLAADIRAGLFDEGAEAAALHGLLWDMTVQKLSESNPEYLATAGGG